jgi:SAM-dependent methyltransferase
MRTLDEAELEATGVVANCRMNRGRRLRDYSREVGFDIVALGPARWLDVGCGEGRALAEAAAVLPASDLVGMDLVDAFASPGPRTRFLVGPLREVEPGGRFDLITAVHALHYVGDKLGALERLRGWLAPGGLLVAHLDLAHILVDERPSPRTVLRWLRARGYAWDPHNHRIRSVPPRSLPDPPWRFLGAREGGPNYTGQPAVASLYAR